MPAMFQFSNSQVVAISRLFGEGGNYSPEEAEELVNKVNSIQKNINKHRRKVISKLDSLASSCAGPKQNISGNQAHPLPMKELLKLAQLQSHHVIHLEIEELQKRIDREIDNGRGVISILNQLAKSTEKGKNCETLQSIARILGDNCYYFGLPKFSLPIEIERVIRKCPINISEDPSKNPKLSRTTDFLSLGFLSIDYGSPSGSVVATSGHKNKSLRASQMSRRLTTRGKGKISMSLRRSTLKKTRFETKGKISMATPLNTMANEQTILSVDEPVYGCGYNFLYAMKKNILDTFTNIKHIIERTYAVTYGVREEFTEVLKEEYLQKMRGINLRVEISWNALLLEFISSLLRVVQLLPECADAELNAAFEEWSSKKNARMDLLEDTIDSFNIEEEKKKIDAELKPWHGHPLNKSILQKLLRKVYETCQVQLTRRKDVLEKFQGEMNDFWQQQKESKSILVQRTSEINDLIFVNPDVRKFVSTLYSYTSRFNHLDEATLEESSISYLKCITEYLHVASSQDIEHNEIEQIIPEELEKISVNMVQFIKNFKAIHRALYELIQAGYFPPVETDSNDSQDNIYDQEEEEEFVSIFLKEFQEKIEISHKKLKSEIGKSLQDCKIEFDSANDNLLRWKDEWIYHVRNVIRLYSVDPILEGPRQAVKQLVNKITPRNAVPYKTEPVNKN